MKRIPGKPDMGLCPRCGLEKPLSDFGTATWIDHRGEEPILRSYPQGYCKPCTRAASQASRETEHGRSINRAATKLYRQRKSGAAPPRIRDLSQVRAAQICPDWSQVQVIRTVRSRDLNRAMGARDERHDL